MGRKPKDDPRVSLSRLVDGGTIPLLASLAKGWGVSEGVAIDRAVQLAAIAESFGTEVIKKSIVKTVDKVDPRIQSGDPVEITPVVTVQPARPRFLKRRT